ncbi:MAG TPA: DUF4149 domain-containing protein [Thermaerobacter sp.]
MSTAWRNLYVLLMAAWFGIMGYYTGILTPTLTRAFPAEFGRIVAALFPGYFRLGEMLALGATLAALLEFRSSRVGSSPPASSLGRTGPEAGTATGAAAGGATSAAAGGASSPGRTGAGEAPAGSIPRPAAGGGWRVALAAAALVLVAVNRELVLPAAHAARGTEAFGALHGLSMGINLLTALLALWGAASGLRASTVAHGRRGHPPAP